jgi:hypothetical protein
MPPASAQAFFKSVLDLIYLQALKDLYAGVAHDFPEEVKLAQLGGLGLLGLPLLVLTAALYFCRMRKVKPLEKIRSYVFYKLLIQFYKVAFLTTMLTNLRTLLYDD